jgi:hypothetical protein
MCVGHNRREVKEATMNGARMYSLERRLAKIEKERGMTGEDDTFNQILRLVGEPTYVTAGEAFIAAAPRSRIS